MWTEEGTVPEERVCEACGETFTPIRYTGRGSTNRKYCYDPNCEEERERDRRRKNRSRRRLKEAVEKRKKAVEERQRSRKEKTDEL